jgi:predicted aconitase with swiveling domain
MEKILNGRPVVAGSAEGVALVSSQPISFWGGINPRTGEITDRRHEKSGETVTGRVFVFPRGKGSSTASAILMESIRAGVAPAAIINMKVDPILALGSIVSDELFNQSVPIVVLPEKDFLSIKDGDHITIEPDGKVKVSSSPTK